MSEKENSASLNQQRCGFVAVIGAPNAGKSTLTNLLTGLKVSIVTHKVQTTRANIKGIFIHQNAQVALIDTPGIFIPQKRLDKAMVKAAWTGVGDAEVILFLVDAAKGITEKVQYIASKLAEQKTPVVLVLNKIDLIEKPRLLELARQLNELARFEQVFMISATRGKGVGVLKNWLADNMPQSPWLYPEDQVSDVPMRYFAAEITREKLFLRLHQELPYAATVETTDWKKLKGAKGIRIEQTIFVARASQKQIILGKQGKTIRQISMESRKEISEVLETPVHLFLFVKVRENWKNDPERYQVLGLEFPDAG